jgi:hypothetical protein
MRPGYHCPERHMGEGISQADDAWALAVTLYFLLTGSLPYPGVTSSEIQSRIAASAPAPLAVFDAGDDDLQMVLDHFMNRDRLARITSVNRFRTVLEEWHPDPSVRQLAPLDEVDEHTDDEEEGDDEEENIQTVMRDFSEVRRQLQALSETGGPELGGGRPKPRPFAPIGEPPAPPAPEPWRPKPHSATQIGGFNPATAPTVLAEDPAHKATALGGFAPAAAQAVAARDAARPHEDPTKPTTAMGGFGMQQARADALGVPSADVQGAWPATDSRPTPPAPPPRPAARVPQVAVPPAPPLPGTPLGAATVPMDHLSDVAPRSGKAALPGMRAEGGGRRPVQFDIADNDSEDDVSTVMVDTSGTDLSAQIEEALGRQLPRSAEAPWATPAPAAHAGAFPTPQPAPHMLAPTGPPIPGTNLQRDISLEHLLENQPDDSGVKRALIVATVLLVIVATAVVLLWLGQEGRL